MEQLRASAFGKSATYRVDESALVVADAAGERRLDLADVRHVRLATLGRLTMCELRAADGRVTSVVNEDAAQRDAYAGFVRALHARLAGRPGVEFVRGSWSLVALFAAIGAVVCGLGAAIVLGWLKVPRALETKANVLLVLGALWLVVGPILGWKSRPRSYDPRDPPGDALTA